MFSDFGKTLYIYSPLVLQLCTARLLAMASILLLHFLLRYIHFVPMSGFDVCCQHDWLNVKGNSNFRFSFYNLHIWYKMHYLLNMLHWLLFQLSTLKNFFCKLKMLDLFLVSLIYLLNIFEPITFLGFKVTGYNYWYNNYYSN